MTFATPIPGVPYTDQAVDAVTAWLEARGDGTDPPVIYTAGSFIPPTDGPNFPGQPVQDPDTKLLTGEWDGYDHGGLSFDKATQEKAAMTLWVPAAWPTVKVNIVGLAQSFGSGNVVFSQGGDAPTETKTIAVAAFYAGVLFTNLTWTAAAGLLTGVQFATLVLTRLADNVADTLNEDFAVLAVALTNGG